MTNRFLIILTPLRLVEVLLIFIFLRFTTLKTEVWIARALSCCGCLFVKLGQSLSLKPYLVGQKMAKSLSGLQESILYTPKLNPRNVLQKHFDKLGINLAFEDIFEFVDAKPIAKASVALVYRARLSSKAMKFYNFKHKDVAVKIVNKGFYKRLKADILIVNLIAFLLDKFSKKLRSIDIISICKTVFSATLAEFDLGLEVKNYALLRQNLCLDDGYDLPCLLTNLSGKDVLVSQWIDGFTLSKTNLIQDYKLDKTKIAKSIINLYCLQVYRDGCFHADMHPGNLIINPQNYKIYLIDCGNVSLLSKQDRVAVAKILYYFLKHNYKAVVGEYLKAGYINSSIDIEAFTAFISQIGEAIGGNKTSNGRDMSAILSSIIEASERFNIKTQPQLLMLQKAILYLEACVYSIDPHFNIWQEMKPWMSSWFKAQTSPVANLINIAKNGLKHLMLNFAKHNTNL